MADLTHVDAAGRARMVDVSGKADTMRSATATGSIAIAPDALALAVESKAPKGAVVAVAEIAGVMAAKRTAELIPLCHPLALSAVEVAVAPTPDGSGLTVTATVRTTGPTGVEMEALTAVSVALLTIYDMLKAVDKAMVIGGVRVIEKIGGRSGELVGVSLPSVDEARAMMLARVGVLAEERVALRDAGGRVLREDVRASRDQPPFDASAMDGWAVRKADLPAVLDIVGESAAGHGWSGTLGRGEAVRISTGAAIPDGADWVVMQEEAERDGERVRVGPAGAAGFVRPRGADFESGDALLSAGTRLDPWRIALAASAGRATVQVSARPLVAIVATGDELAAPGASPSQWQIHDSVGPGLAAWCEARGCETILLDTLPDDRATVSAALSRADCDLLITIGGASVGDHDLVKPALRDLGLEMVVEGVAVRPGKPTWFGLLDDGRRVLGLPGNPVSAMVCVELFAAPLLAALHGAAPAVALRRARLAAALPANGPREHYARAAIRFDDAGGVTARAAHNQDSSLVSVLAGAGALIRRLPYAPPAAAGETVEILLLDRS